MILAARPVAYPERRRRPPVRLGEGARRALRAVAEVVAPSRPLGFDPGERVVAFVESYLPYLPPLLARGFPLGLALVEWGPIVRRASSLAPAARRRYYEALGRSRFGFVREIWAAVRGLAACAIYGQPETRALMGYDHQPWIDEKVRFRRDRFGAPEPW